MIKPHRLTKRQREVLYYVAFGELHHIEPRTICFTIPGQSWRGPVVKYTLAGVDVTAIMQSLRQLRLIRRQYVPAIMRPANRVTAEGIEELLCPTS